MVRRFLINEKRFFFCIFMIVKTLKKIVRQEISALFESAESDFEYVKEARRVYNKIVKKAKE